MWMEKQPSAQSSFQKSNVDNSCQKTRKIRYYIFEVLPNFTVFLYFVQSILARILFSLPHFLHVFWQNIYPSCYLLTPCQVSLSGWLYFVRYWAIYVGNCLLTRFWHHKSETKLIFLIEPFLYMTKNTKQYLRWNKERFSSFLKGFHGSK